MKRISQRKVDKLARELSTVFWDGFANNWNEAPKLMKDAFRNVARHVLTKQTAPHNPKCKAWPRGKIRRI